MSTIEDFDGGTGCPDNTQALQNALAKTKVITFGPGVYNFSKRVTHTVQQVLLQGCGADVTILNWQNANGGLALTWDGEKETEKRDKSDPTFIPI